MAFFIAAYITKQRFTVLTKNGGGDHKRRLSGVHYICTMHCVQCTLEKQCTAHHVIKSDLHPKNCISEGPTWNERKTSINTLRLRQNGCLYADHLFKCIFLNEIFLILVQILLKFHYQSLTIYLPALVQIMAWHQISDKPLSGPMMAYFTDAYMCHVALMSWPLKCFKILYDFVEHSEFYLWLQKKMCFQLPNTASARKEVISKDEIKFNHNPIKSLIVKKREPSKMAKPQI